MPRPPLKELKPEYLQFIELIRECRKQELGKMGRIFVQKDSIDAIASSYRIEIYIEQLGEEGIFDIVRNTEPPALCRIIEKEGKPTFVEFNCRQTTEQIAAYKDSLQGVRHNTDAPLVIAQNWESIHIRFTTDREVVITTPNGNRITDFEAMGFLDRKSDRPNSAWRLLYLLTRDGGTIRNLPTPVPDDVKKQKQLLAEQLQKTFGITTDPFHPYHDGHEYRIKIILEPPVQLDAQENEVDDIFDEFTGS